MEIPRNFASKSQFVNWSRFLHIPRHRLDSLTFVEDKEHSKLDYNSCAVLVFMKKLNSKRQQRIKCKNTRINFSDEGERILRLEFANLDEVTYFDFGFDLLVRDIFTTFVNDQISFSHIPNSISAWSFRREFYWIQKAFQPTQDVIVFEIACNGESHQHHNDGKQLTSRFTESSHVWVRHRQQHFSSHEDLLIINQNVLWFFCDRLTCKSRISCAGKCLEFVHTTKVYL